ncbi:substrate-binding periplasmic protein [Colwellia echini]|uniref:Amino acid ABC transporter substrate-binding protein n=1 Tax=Colwellia echini TaxID=1982103 RepID=A0ABY3MSY9_9GAMM|nr:transporter substrate-binding domain-containing protein [Colwellia echini]TYK64237.1 amino acid ABC transporter substrate-binding protein [Colwellia echini]
MFSIYAYKAYSVDIIKIKHQQLSKNKAKHNLEVIRRALKITEPQYGPFVLERVNIRMTSDREVKIVQKGKILNATITPANELADKALLPIQVPIRLGLLSYRVLLINKNDLSTFAQISNLNDLKQQSVGLLQGWKTAQIYKQNDIDLIETHNYEGLFLMLNKHRFNYIPRGVYEIFDEVEGQKLILPNVVIEPTIVLFIPTVTYLYVSPKYPRLANRLNAGLRQLLASGELKSLLYQYYGEDIKRANIKGRNIITIPNSYYSKEGNVNKEHLLHLH